MSIFRLLLCYYIFLSSSLLNLELMGFEKKTLKLTLGEVYPLAYVNEQGLKSGVFLDLFKEIEKQSNLRFEIELLPFARAVKKMKNSENSLFHFYDLKLFNKKMNKLSITFCFQEVIFLRENNSNFTSIRDLETINYAYLRGSYFDKTHRNGIRNKGIAVKNYDILLKLLNSGRVDAIIGNRFSLLSGIKKQGIKPTYDSVIEIEKLKTAIFISKKNTLSPKLILSLKKSAENLRTQGVFEKILRTYTSDDYQACN